MEVHQNQWIIWEKYWKLCKIGCPITWWLQIEESYDCSMIGVRRFLMARNWRLNSIPSPCKAENNKLQIFKWLMYGYLWQPKVDQSISFIVFCHGHFEWERVTILIINSYCKLSLKVLLEIVFDLFESIRQRTHSIGKVELGDESSQATHKSHVEASSRLSVAATVFNIFQLGVHYFHLSLSTDKHVINVDWLRVRIEALKRRTDKFI